MSGASVIELPADGAPLRSERDILDVIVSAALETDWIALPVSRLHADFFELRNGVAGALLQKAVNYRLNVAILGDISDYVSRSESLAAFVRESNRGRHVWFVPDRAALDAKLATGA